jgi:micrococcal nuclease
VLSRCTTDFACAAGLTRALRAGRLGRMIVSSLVALLVGAVGIKPGLATGTPAGVVVVGVVNGDTVEAQFEDGNGDTVRLIGIDAPDLADGGRPAECFGPEARDRAWELLGGQVVTLELDSSQEERDPFGRLLAYVYLPDGRNFAAVMLAEGYVREYSAWGPYGYQSTFQAAQQAAIRGQRGLWAPDTCAGQTGSPPAPSTAGTALLASRSEWVFPGV